MPKFVFPYWIGKAMEVFQEIALAYRPYPKPTQVDK